MFCELMAHFYAGHPHICALRGNYSPGHRGPGCFASLCSEQGPAAIYAHALWICPTCSGEYACDVREREAGDDSCPYCADRKALPGYNTLDMRHPDLMREWLAAENVLIGNFPDEILPSSSAKAWWCCPDCEYKYSMTPKQRVLKKKRGHNSCPRCNGHRWLQVHFV